jgi:hypothetical protein
MKILFEAYFHQKNFGEKVSQKVFFGQDPDPVKNLPDPQH